MTSNGSAERVRFGPYEADLRTHELWKYGTRVKLVGQPFAILEMLLERPGDLITRDELRSRLWPGDTFVDFDHGLNAAVNKLRDALNDSAENPKYIETLPRRGYRFLAKVEVPVPATPAAPPPPVTMTSPSTTMQQLPPPNPKSEPQRTAAYPAATEHPAPRRPFRVVLFALAIVLLIFAGNALLRMHSEKSANEEERQAKLQAERQLTKGRNQGPQFSPDGNQIAYGSDRSGAAEIWVSNRDGSDARQFTDLGGCGTPRWSPDGKSIAFDRRETFGSHQIYMVPADGGAPKQLTNADGDNAVPSWSRDGHWVYFASDRTGDSQVWKVPARGGAATQVTHNGGFAAFESADGKDLYYAKTKFPNPEIWRMPVGGGAEAHVSPRIVPGTWASWGLTNAGLYFIEEHPGLSPRVSFLDFATYKIFDVAALDRFPFFFSVSQDGKWLAYEESETQEGNIVVIPNRGPR